MFYEAFRYIKAVWLVEGYWKSSGFFQSKENAKKYLKEKYPKNKRKVLVRKFKDALPAPSFLFFEK